MNCYATLGQVEQILGDLGQDASLLATIEAASRAIDGEAGRRFFVETGTRYFDGARANDRVLFLDDFLSLTSLEEDDDQDGTYSEVWTEGAHFETWPANSWPKLGVELVRAVKHDQTFAARRRGWKAEGIWGAGNLRDNAPWADSGVTGTVGTTAGTALTLSAAGDIDAAHTLQLGDEQMFVSAVSSIEGVTTATVERGVNGTTAAAHTSSAVYLAEYPATVVVACAWFAVDLWRELMQAGYESERIGQYSYQRAATALRQSQRRAMLGPVSKGLIL